MGEGIADRLAETMEKMSAKQVDNALIQVSIALDATAKKVHGKGGRQVYQTFIHDNLGLITRISFGPPVLNIRVKYDLNRNQPADQPAITPDADGRFTIEQVLYHAVRCGLLHESHIPEDLVFSDEQMIKVDSAADPGNPRLVLPSSLVYGLIVAVVTEPANAGLTVEERFGLNVPGLTTIPINRLWGKRAEFIALLDALKPFHQVTS
jgi:hypothetical protein